MSNESMMIVKNGIEQRNIKSKQLCALQAKEVEVSEKETKLLKLLEQAGLDHESYMRSNLTGDASDQVLQESKINLKELADSIQETKETLKFISETRTKLNFEISYLNGDIAVHRGILCLKLAREAHDEMAANKKLNEKLVAGYAAFISSGDYDRSWPRFLMCNFPHPSEPNIKLAVEKFKASNEFMRD
jgi:hypothetical protein